MQRAVAERRTKSSLHKNDYDNDNGNGNDIDTNS